MGRVLDVFHCNIKRYKSKMGTVIYPMVIDTQGFPLALIFNFARYLYLCCFRVPSIKAVFHKTCL